MTETKNLRPIIILGCPRSGTKLIARIIGGHPDIFLITEHKLKKIIPEDDAKIIDCDIWFNFCKFDEYDDRGYPIVRRPNYNKEDFDKVRKVYLDLANGKRLATKNPQHLTRVDILQEIFPDAQFVFCIRNPWHTIQSSMFGSLGNFYVLSEKTKNTTDDFLLKSASSWQEAIDMYLSKKDSNSSIAIRYEDVIYNTKDTLDKLFNFLGLDDKLYLEKVMSLPKQLNHNFYPIKRKFNKSEYKSDINKMLENGCNIFSYPVSVDVLEGDFFSYFFSKKNLNKTKKRVLCIFGKESIKKIIYFILRKLNKVFILRKKIFLPKVLFKSEVSNNPWIMVQDNKIQDKINSNDLLKSIVLININKCQFNLLKNKKKVVIANKNKKPSIILSNIKVYSDKECNINKESNIIKFAQDRFFSNENLDHFLVGSVLFVNQS
jgi:hypothetical protein